MATDLIFFGLLVMASGVAPKVISIREDYQAMKSWVRGGFMALAVIGFWAVVYGVGSIGVKL